MPKEQTELLWAVVKVESGIPVTVEAYRDRQSAEMREQSLRKDMHPENDETGVFEIQKKIGEFWDTHDLADYWEQTHPVEFELDIQSEVTYYSLEVTLADKVRSMAKQRGVSSETLLNLWVKEKLQEETG